MNEIFLKKKKSIKYNKIILYINCIIFFLSVTNCGVNNNDLNNSINAVLDYNISNSNSINKEIILKQNTTNQNINSDYVKILTKSKLSNEDIKDEKKIQDFYNSCTNLQLQDKLNLSVFGLEIPLNTNDIEKLKENKDISNEYLINLQTLMDSKEPIKYPNDKNKKNENIDHIKLLSKYLNWNFLYYVSNNLKLDITIPVTIFSSILVQSHKNEKNNGYNFLGIKTLNDFLTKPNILKDIYKKLNNEDEKNKSDLRNLIIGDVLYMKKLIDKGYDKTNEKQEIKNINVMLNNFKHNCANDQKYGYKLYKSVLYVFRIAILDMLLKETSPVCSNIYPFLFSVKCGKCGNKKNPNLGCIHNKTCLKTDITKITLKRNNQQENKIKNVVNSSNKDNALQERFNHIYKQLTNTASLSMKLKNKVFSNNNLIQILLKGALYQFYSFNKEILEQYKNNKLYKESDNTYFPLEKKDIQNYESYKRNIEKYKIGNQDVVKIYSTIVKVLENVNNLTITFGPINYYVKDSDLLKDF